MIETPAAEFRTGRVLGDSFRALGNNVVSFLTISLLLIAPVYLFLAWAAWDENLAMSLPAEGLEFAIVVVETLLSFVAHAAIVYGAYRELQGRRARFADSVVNGLRRAGPVILVAMGSSLLILLGFLLLIVPGLIVATMYWVAVPAAVMEDRGVGGSLNRSAALSKGYRWRVFGVILVAIVIQLVSDALVENVLDFDNDFYVALLGAWLLSAATTAIAAVLSTVSYHELRRVKEGVEADEIAAVFD